MKKLIAILMLLPMIAFGKIKGVPTAQEQMYNASLTVTGFIRDYTAMTNKIARAQTPEYKAALAKHKALKAKLDPNKCNIIPGSAVCVYNEFGIPIGNIGANFGQCEKIGGNFEVLPTISMADYKKQARDEMSKLSRNIYVKNEFAKRKFRIR